jgi:hypothetical protein
MNTLKKCLRAAFVVAVCVALIGQPAAMAGYKKPKHPKQPKQPKYPVYKICDIEVWLYGIDCYGDWSYEECDGTYATGALKLNYKTCKVEYQAKGKVYNHSGCSYYECVDIWDFDPYAECGCGSCLDYLDSCIHATYSVDAPRKSRGKYNKCVNCCLRATGKYDHSNGGDNGDDEA